MPLTAYMPEAIIPDQKLSIAIYQRLSATTASAEVDAIEAELGDRFGPPPRPARNLLWIVRFRLLALAAGVGAVQMEAGEFVIRLRPGRELDREGLARRLRNGATVSAHQLRLERAALGEDWREGLVRALDAIAGASAVKVTAS